MVVRTSSADYHSGQGLSLTVDGRRESP